MKITIKQLQGSECTVEATPTTSILEIKQQIEEKLNIPVGAQRLLLIGRALADDQLINSYPSIKDGTKLNLAVKKPEGLYEITLKEYKKMGMNDTQAAKAANRLLQEMKEKVNRMSLDDLQRLSADFLRMKEKIDKQRSNKPNVS